MKLHIVTACSYLAACTHQPQYVQPRSIEGARDRIVAGQHIQLESLQGDAIDLGPDHVVELVTADGKRLPMRLDELVKDCPAHGDDPLRLCNQDNIKLVIIGDERQLDRTVGEGLRAALGIGMLIALPVCSFECSSPYNYISDGVLALAGVALIAGVIVLAKNLRHPMT